MPYFVFLVCKDPQGDATAKIELEYLDEFEKFKPAKDLCRELRVEKGEEARMVFAKDKKEAKRLLREKRKPSGSIEEWES